MFLIRESKFNYSETAIVKDMFDDDNSHYAKKKIGDVRVQDVKVQVIGEVTETKSKTEYEISDGSGKIIIILKQDEPMVDKIRDGMIVKALGRLLGDTGDLLSVDHILDYSDLDFELYKKSLDLKAKYLE